MRPTHKHKVQKGKKVMFKNRRDWLNAVVAGTMNEEVKEFAKAELTKMDNRNSARTEKPSKRQLENEPVKAKIVEVLDPVLGKTASDIAKEVGISTQKASSLCVQLVAENKAKAEQGKKNKVYYAFVAE